tara:strand:+ start:537 stop:779 length:243 start_codon:yes stop_codon:yes gene_type:complete
MQNPPLQVTSTGAEGVWRVHEPGQYANGTAVYRYTPKTLPVWWGCEDHEALVGSAVPCEHIQRVWDVLDGALKEGTSWRN